MAQVIVIVIVIAMVMVTMIIIIVIVTCPAVNGLVLWTRTLGTGCMAIS